MLDIIFGILGIYAIIRAIWRILTFPFRRYRQPPRRYYYDEFDWWQDNQGF